VGEAVSARDLRPVGPLDTVDRAFLLVRRGGASLAWRPILGGLVVGAAVLLVYYVERVEGIRTLRLPMAAVLVLAWWVRAIMLARSAREATRMLWDGASIPDGAGRALSVVRTASIVAMGLWCWLWVLVGASLLGTFGVPIVLPVLALRGAVAPSWLARAGCGTEGGIRAFVRSVGDSSGRRAGTTTVEFILLVGVLGLALNLMVALAIMVMLGQSMLGLDVAFFDTFLSVRNTFLMLAVGAISLALLEPLRVGISAVTYVDAMVRQEGLDLRAAVDHALEAAARRRGFGSSSAGTTDAPASSPVGPTAALLVVLGLVLVGSQARAQEFTPAEPPAAELIPLPPGSGPDGVAPPADPDSWDPTGSGMPPKQPIDFASMMRAGSQGFIAPARSNEADDEVRERVAGILDRSEFQEFADTRGRGLRDLFTRLLEWLLRPREPTRAPSMGTGLAIPLPPAGFFLAAGAVLLLLVLGYLIATRVRDRQSQAPAEGAGVTAGEDPRDRSPEAHLDDAAILARDGRFRDALRALYLATLVALDRRRMISFDPTLTNWQYMRQMPRGDVRARFGIFTRLFDYKWYGDEPTTEGDYSSCRRLADGICSEEAR